MKSHKLNLKVIIASVGVLSLVIFSGVLLLSHAAQMESLGEILLHYGLIIAPISILWVLLDEYLWHTHLFQSFRKSLNIPPDMRGRWEGLLQNADGSEPQKFVVEVKQTLTTIKVFSYSPIAHSASILAEIAASHHEDSFTLCYLWEGAVHTSLTDIHQSERFYGYTMLDMSESNSPKSLKGSYFTNRKAAQTRGGIQLSWISKELKKRFE